MPSLCSEIGLRFVSSQAQKRKAIDTIAPHRSLDMYASAWQRMRQGVGYSLQIRNSKENLESGGGRSAISFGGWHCAALIEEGSKLKRPAELIFCSFGQRIGILVM